MLRPQPTGEPHEFPSQSLLSRGATRPSPLHGSPGQKLAGPARSQRRERHDPSRLGRQSAGTDNGRNLLQENLSRVICDPSAGPPEGPGAHAGVSPSAAPGPRRLWRGLGSRDNVGPCGRPQVPPLRPERHGFGGEPLHPDGSPAQACESNSDRQCLVLPRVPRREHGAGRRDPSGSLRSLPVEVRHHDHPRTSLSAPRPGRVGPRFPEHPATPPQRPGCCLAALRHQAEQLAALWSDAQAQRLQPDIGDDQRDEESPAGGDAGLQRPGSLPGPAQRPDRPVRPGCVLRPAAHRPAAVRPGAAPVFEDLRPASARPVALARGGTTDHCPRPCPRRPATVGPPRAR